MILVEIAWVGLVLLGGSDGEAKPKGKRKFVTREEEPDQ